MKETNLSLYNATLYKALDCRPEDHKFTGIVNDLGQPVGKCSCGHTIRYEYIVRDSKTGKERILGSECIGNYSALGHIKKEVDALNKKLKEEKKQEKEKELEKELLPLLENRSFYKEWLKETLSDLRSKHIFAPYGIWKYAYESDKINLKTTKGKIKRVISDIERYKKELERFHGKDVFLHIEKNRKSGKKIA